MILSEHIHCVAITNKMTEQIEQRICIKFCVKLEHFSMETIWMIQKAIAMSTWWLAASSQNTPAHASLLMQNFLAKYQIYSKIWRPATMAFPKTKITFEREEISDWLWDSGKYNGAADSNWENCVRSQGAYLEGDWGIIILCTMFLVSSSINVSIFHGWIPSGQTSDEIVYMKYHIGPVPMENPESPITFTRTLTSPAVCCIHLFH